MDMWEPYVQSTLAHVPGAATKIVHDPFHLVKAMNEAVNDVRKREHARLQAGAMTSSRARANSGSMAWRTCPPSTLSASRRFGRLTWRLPAPG